MLVFFFFQAEDGIRDGRVTGVQTCALPIWRRRRPRRPRRAARALRPGLRVPRRVLSTRRRAAAPADRLADRGERGRVGGAAGAGVAGQLAHRGRRPRGERARGARAAGGGAMSRVWLVIVGMAVATYLTRAPMFLALAHRPLPPRVRLWLRLVPLAVLPALALPLVLVRDGRLVLGLAHPPLWGAVVVFVLAARGVNLLVSVATAVAVVALLRALG